MLCEAPYIKMAGKAGEIVESEWQRMVHVMKSECVDPKGKTSNNITKLPLDKKLTMFPMRCGKCLPCLLAKRTYWTTRIAIEYSLHNPKMVQFLTLTIDDNKFQGDLKKKHFSEFIKRLRSYLQCKSIRLRFYAIKEYGTKGTKRQHLHAILFGLPRGTAHLVKKAWYFGFIKMTDCGPKKAYYITKYMLKGQFYGRNLPDGASNTWHHMSRNPGLGFEKIMDMADELNRIGYDKNEIVDQITIGRRTYLLTGYALKKLNDLRSVAPHAIKERTEKFVDDYLCMLAWDKENPLEYWYRQFCYEHEERERAYRLHMEGLT